MEVILMDADIIKKNKSAKEGIYRVRLATKNTEQATSPCHTYTKKEIREYERRINKK